jgi:hypothetical protein
MIVYHGSHLKIETIDLTKSRVNRDFGQGFYVTNIRSQAEFWAERMGRKMKTEGCITEFIFCENAFTKWEFRVLRFSDYTEEWLDFVILNRNPDTPVSVHDYDIVEGPVADDAISIRINDYLDGLVSKNVFLEEMKFKKRTHQICFCTVRSLQTIKRTDAKPNGIFYHIDDYIVEKLATERGLSETVATDLYYTSDTYKLLIDESTEFFQKPWTDIYEIFQQELKKKKR